MKRIIDLSIVISPNGGKNPFIDEQPVDCLHTEISQREHPRGEIFAFLKYDSFLFKDHPNKIYTNIICTTDPYPGTHVESYYPEKWFYPDQKERKLYRRDVSRIAASRLVGEAVVIDFPYEKFRAIDSIDLENSNADIREGDIVFFRTGYSELYKGKYPDQGSYDGSPGLTNAAADWLVKRKIRIFGIDCRGMEAERLKNPNARLDVHRIFHLNNVTLMEDLANLKELKPGRNFVICGSPLRMEFVSGAPGRVIAIENDKIIDLSHTLKQYPIVEGGSKKIRTEPIEERNKLMKRSLVTPFTITDFGIDDSVAPQYLEFPSSLGTHINLPSSDPSDLEKYPLSKLVGQTKLIDCRHIGPKEAVMVEDLEKGYGDSSLKKIMLISGYSDRYYHNDKYYENSPYLDSSCIEWLVSKGIHLLVTDFADIDGSCNSDCTSSKLSQNDIAFVQGTINGWLCVKDEVFLACLPLPLRGLKMSPVHVIAQEDW